MTINYLAVIVAAIINMGLGTLWYGPFFGKYWMSVTGVSMDAVSPEKRKSMMWSSMAIGFVLALIMNVVFAHMIAFSVAATSIAGVSVGIATGFMIWLGFMLLATSHAYLWEGKPVKLWLVHAGYYLVLLLVNGALLGAWM